MTSAGVYPGHRILDVMRGAPRYADAIQRLLCAAIPPDCGPILDFGAGDGMFAERLAAEGYVVHCIEPDVRNQQSLSQMVDIVISDVRTLPDRTYSFIYAINVLEHIDHIENHLYHLRRVLNPGGTLFIFVPAFKVLWTSLDDEVGHRRRFDRRSMLSLLDGSGFAVVATRYFDSAGFVAALAVRGLERFGAFRYSERTVGFYDRFALPVSLVGDRVLSGVIGKSLITIATPA